MSSLDYVAIPEILSAVGEARPKVCGGRICVTGVRMPLARILAELADGEALAEICWNFEIDQEAVAECLGRLSLVFDRMRCDNQEVQHEPSSGSSENN